jgi:putative addiction module component (TIGR02574 family)
MSSMYDSLGIAQLTIPQRLTLVHEIWDSIAQEQGAVPLSDAQKAEIDRRLARHAANPAAARPWSEVDARLTQKYGR